MSSRRNTMRGLVGGAALACLGLALGVGPGRALAEGPDSGEEVHSTGPSPQMLQRIYKESAARKAKQARIAELRNKIAVLRGALPGILTEGLRESDLYNTEFRDYQSKAMTFRPRWDALWKVLAMTPPARISSVYEEFGLKEVWSADTTDWSQAKRRSGEADGDDFYLYCDIVFPKPIVDQDLYTIDWSLRGFDHEGKERLVYYAPSYATGDYIRPKGRYVTYRRRVTGLGLSPGWYEAEATLKIKGKYYLQRRFYGAVKVSRVNPLLTAPPVYYYRYKDEAKIKLTSVSFDSRGARRGEINPADVKISGRYQVDAEMAGADRSLVAGADVYPAGADGKIQAYGARPIRAAFRFRQDLKRPTGAFGSETESRVKQLDGGLNPGKYVLRVWVAASKGTSVYWAFEDKPFEVQAAKPLPPTPERRGGRR